MRFIKLLFALLMLIPLMSFANGKHTPGTITVVNAGSFSYAQGAYNVRHNPAVSNGRIDVTFIPDTQTLFFNVQSSTIPVKFFSCSASASSVGAEQFAEWEFISAMLLSGGNGSSLYLTADNGVCSNVTITSSSAQLD